MEAHIKLTDHPSASRGFKYQTTYLKRKGKHTAEINETGVST